MKFKSRLILILTILMMLQSALFGGSAFAAGTNLPNVMEYGLYNYVDDNKTAPTAIGSSYNSPPWSKLTAVPYSFNNNVGIGIKFVVNVATSKYWEQNVTKLKMYDTAGTQVAATVKRMGDGTNNDDNRNYIFVIPQDSLQPASSYKIIIDKTLTANNDQQAGEEQKVEFTTAADNTVPTWSSGSLTASGISTTSLTISWTPMAQDDVAVSGYEILKDGTEIGTVSGVNSLSYSVSGLASNTLYNFQVLAKDSAGNRSKNGPSTSATTIAATNSSSVSLSLNQNSIAAGGSVTASGTAGPNKWVSIEAINDSQNVVFFDAVKSDASGNYRATFKVLDGSSGTLTILAGYGSNMASSSLAILPELTSNVTVASDGSNKNLAITANTPSGLSVTVPQGAEATINVSALLGNNSLGGVSTSSLPAMNITANTNLNSNPVLVDIPEGTIVSAPAGWTGSINAPKVLAADTVTVTPDSGKNATVSTVIEVGYGNVPLTFNKAVRILIPGQAGKDVGYYRSGTFNKISTVLSVDTQTAGDALAAGGEGKIFVGSDLVVWTKHFTQFVTYTQSSNGGGGGSGDSQTPYWPSGSSLEFTKVQQEVSLSWTAAKDNTGITGYKIYMEGSEIATVDGSTLTYKAVGVTGPHTFKIEAGNAAGKWTTNGPSAYVSGSGNNPLNYISSNLTSISGSSSSDGEAVDGSTSVPVKPTIRIIFDRNVTNDAIWSANQQCFSMQDSGGSSVSISVSKISNTLNFEERQHVFITPVSNLTAGKTYKIIISGNLKANNGKTMGNNAAITFTVAGGAAITTAGPTITTGEGSVDPAIGATVGQGDYAKVVIPANALKEGSPVTVKVRKVDSSPAAPADAKTASDVYEFTIGNNTSYSFASNVAITLSFNASAIGADQAAALFYYDEAQGKWINLYGTVSGNSITVQLNHFTKFAVFAVKKTAVVPVVPVIAMPAVTLNDVTGHWAEDSINKLVALGAVSGYPDGSFKPNANITRAEFVTVLVKAFKLESKSGKVFPDTVNSWAKDYIATATAYGIASGYNDQNFGADDLITREQMVVMVIKAAQLAPASAGIVFADSNSISAWARESIATALNKGIIKGFPDNTIRPGNNASRAEAITVIANALN